MIDWTIVAETAPAFWGGLQITLLLLVISVASGFVLSVPLAVMRASPRRALWMPVWLFTYVIRGTPLLVQLFIIYYGVPQFDLIRNSDFWPLFRSPWFCAWLAFTLNTTAYTTEIFAGALKATPAGDVEVARSLGMSSLTIWRRILLPGALRRALPQYGNEVVMLMHATAIASTVSLVEVTRVARDVYYNHLLPAEAFGTAAIIYFVLTAIFVGGFKLLERRYLRHLRPMATTAARA